MKRHLKIFKALGDKNRLRIIKMLEVKPMCVCEITSVLDLAPSTVSKHLSLLQDAGLIEDTKDGRWVNYALSTFDPSPLAGDILGLLGGTLDADPVVVEDRKKAKKADRVKICR
jgi:ArsR family transcriptional regulator